MTDGRYELSCSRASDTSKGDRIRGASDEQWNIATKSLLFDALIPESILYRRPNTLQNT